MALERSLIEVVRAGGFETSLITSFCAYLPFYEEVVLRKLRGSGCRHNVVLVDAAQFGHSLASAETRPRYAGREYTLLPVHSTGAFHPKITLLIGRAKAAVYVGSHNLTISGFGYNRELTTLVEFNPKKDEAGVAYTRAIWRSVCSWVGSQTDRLPSGVEESVLAIRSFAPWLEGSTEAHTEDERYLAQTENSLVLWEQLKPMLPMTAKRVVILGAFFDQQLRFVETLHRLMPASKITLGIEPRTVSIPLKASTTDWLDVRDASALYKETGYLHAKALYFDAGGKDDLLVVGSANPSAPAWLKNAAGRNEEAVVVRRGALARVAAKDLGLDSVPSLSKVTDEGWAVVAVERQRAKEAPGGGAAAVLAGVEDDGFTILRAALGNEVAESGVALDSRGNEVAQLTEVRVSDTTQTLLAPVAVTQAASELILRTSNGSSVRALVHHTPEIRELARSTKQVQLRAALDGMGDGTGDLAKLIAAVERVIFDEHEAQPDGVLRPGHATGTVTNSTTSPAKPESLAIDLKDSKHVRKHQRMLASGNLAYLLDVLIRRLGIGLERTTPDVDGKGRSEEEQPDQDDDDAPQVPPQPAIDDAVVARLVRNKAKNLVRRMVAQMAQAAAAHSTDPVVLLQLVAVIALLREMRLIERLPKWRAAHERLLSRDAEEALLFGVLTYLFGRRYQLYQAIVNATGDERFDELARLKGLLIWLTWDCDIGLEESYDYAEEPADVERRVESKAVLLELAQILIGDELALEEASNSILHGINGGEQRVATRWLSNYLEFAARVERYLATIATHGGQAKAQLGDLAFNPSIQPLRLRVVSEVADTNLALVDFGDDDSKVRYTKDRVISVGR